MRVEGYYLIFIGIKRSVVRYMLSPTSVIIILNRGDYPFWVVFFLVIPYKRYPFMFIRYFVPWKK
jgi:hypothetical protein